MSRIKIQSFWIILSLLLIITAGLSIINQWDLYFLLFLLLGILLVSFIKYPEIGLYLVAFLYPFNYLEFIYGQINVPYVDLVAMVLFASWIIRIAYQYFYHDIKPSMTDFPAWFFMLLFVLSGVLSLTNVESEYFLQSVKYLFRPILFFYLIFVLLPFNLIDSFKKLFITFKVMFVMGILVSLMGVISLVLQPYEAVRRAIPIGFAGIYPLGTNHNLIAEVLICLIPIAFILFLYEKKVLLKNVYLLGAILMIGINLLTLSRGGWLALGIQGLVLLVLKFRNKVRTMLTSFLFYISLVLLAPVAYLMYKLTMSTVMLSASISRLKLIEISWILFNENPIIGKGVGSFTYILWQFNWYIIEHGDVIDAHGFIFKQMPEMGILGVITFLALLGYIVYLLAKAYRKTKKTDHFWLIFGMLLAVIGAIVFELFGTGYYTPKLWFIIGLALTSLKLCKLNFIKKV